MELDVAAIYTGVSDVFLFTFTVYWRENGAIFSRVKWGRDVDHLRCKIFR